ncbi:MAG TPA: FAD-dependent monooxygenase [Burkholderiales bacterium]|nr:FAD-dependent monooxygenase [Burkholderiales bacterium]
MAESVGVAIAGAGPIGCALAAALRGAPFAVARLGDEAAARDRPIALSHGSRLILERLGLWSGVRATPIRAVHVSQRGALGRTLMTAREHGLPALGYVASYADVLAPLAAAAPAAAAALVDWTPDRDGVRVRTRGSEGEIRTRLLVLADGGGAVPMDHAREYGQQALVAEVRPERPHRGVAWERFTAEGPIALLPFGDDLALVWSAPAPTIRRLLQMSEPEFLAALGASFGGKLGAFTSVGQRGAFPLSLRYRTESAGANVIVIGNAAQTLHPVAGQGLNLGLRDAWELAELLLDTPAHRIGDAGLVSRFVRRRTSDRRAGIAVTDSLVRLFSNDWPLIGAARGAGLLAFDILPPARRFLARRMMFGTRGLP